MSELDKTIKTKKTGKNVCASAPKVSIIIPAYNISDYIAGTLDSVLAQTYKNYEIIVVNDGSKDTEELEVVLEPYFDYIVYANQENGGAAKARNTAISLARGELLAFLDGDDIWYPQFLDASVNFLEKSNSEMVYCDAELFGEQLFAGRTFMQDAPSIGEVNTLTLISGECNVITSGTIIKKELIEKFGGFDLELPRTQDFDLWFRLARNNVKIAYQTKVLLKYCVRSDNLSGNSIDRCKRNIRALDIIDGKYELNEKEKAVWKEQMLLCEAELELELGKFCLIQEDFSNARTHFNKANEFFRKPKLSAINWLMRFSPKLTLQLFRKIRPSEFSFISPDKSL